MAAEEHLFSVEEADSVLNELRDRLKRIRSARDELVSSSDRIKGRVAEDGGGVDGRDYWESLATLREEVEAVSQRGVILRDPETGLVDFPAERDGARIFLCWRSEEDSVRFWHDTETGFSGRRPL